MEIRAHRFQRIFASGSLALIDLGQALLVISKPALSKTVLQFDRSLRKVRENIHHLSCFLGRQRLTGRFLSKAEKLLISIIRHLDVVTRIFTHAVHTDHSLFQKFIVNRGDLFKGIGEASCKILLFGFLRKHDRFFRKTKKRRHIIALADGVSHVAIA